MIQIQQTKVITIFHYEYKTTNITVGIPRYITINIKYIEDIFNDEYIYFINVKSKDCEFNFRIKEESIFEPFLKLEKIRNIIETDKQLNDEIHEKIILSLEDYFDNKYKEYFKNKYGDFTAKKNNINLQGSIKLTTVAKPNKKELKIKSKSSLNIDFKRPEFILLNELYYHLKLMIAIKKN
jgi:hypothetical protein